MEKLLTVYIILKMGWYKLPIKTAVALVNMAANNLCSCMADCTGDVLTKKAALKVLAITNPDYIWMRLVVDSYNTLHNTPHNHLFLSLRWEIEEGLRHGMTLAEARKEWDV